MATLPVPAMFAAIFGAEISGFTLTSRIIALRSRSETFGGRPDLGFESTSPVSVNRLMIELIVDRGRETILAISRSLLPFLCCVMMIFLSSGVVSFVRPDFDRFSPLPTDSAEN